MTSPRSKPRQNNPSPRRERSLQAAAGWSVFVVLGVAIAIVLVGFTVPNTPLYNYWRLVMVNGQVSPGSELLRQLLDQINREDTLFVTPVSLLCGGIAFGRLSPHVLNRRRVLFFAIVVSASIILTCLIFIWGLVLHDQHWHLNPGEMDTQKAMIQTVASVAWIFAYTLGTFGGLLWRDAGRNRRPSEPPSPTLKSASH